VPMQESYEPMYDSAMALSRGTLFPGLDLPFMNSVNSAELKNTPLGDLMAVDFAANELLLYLDTHPDDAEAFSAYKDILTLQAKAHEKFVRLYGPVSHCDLSAAKSFTWLNNPWPWDYCAKTEG